MDEQRDNAIFVIENKEITCKKSLLLKYDYFSSLLGSQFRESRQKKIHISEENVSAENFQLLINFIQGQDIQINYTNVVSLLSAADFFSITSLKLKCVDFIKPSNVPNQQRFNRYYAHTQQPQPTLQYYVELLDIVEKIIPELKQTVLQEIQNTYDWQSRRLSYFKEAIEQGYISAFSALLEIVRQQQNNNQFGFGINTFDLNSPVENQRYLLDIAIEHDQKEMVKLLLKENVYIGYIFSDSKGLQYTPLSYAASLNNIDMVKLLIECYAKNTNQTPSQNKYYRGYSIHNDQSNGMTALHYAVQHQNVKMVELILKVRKTEITMGDKTPFHLAFELGNAEMIKLFIAYGADPAQEYEKKPQRNFYHEDQNASINNFFHYAALHGLAKKVIFLLNKPEGLSAKNPEGLCPLHIALQKQQDDIVKLFVQKNPYVVDVHQQNILHYIVLNKAPRRYRALLQDTQICQKLFTKDETENLPVHYAMVSGDWEITKFMIDHGALDAFTYNETFLNVKKIQTPPWNETREEKKTPLDEACDKGNKDFVIQVIKYLAENRVRHAPRLASNLLYWAAYREYYDIVKYLVEEKHADVNLFSSNGDSFLHWAAKKGRLEAVKFLVKHNADVNHQSDNQRTALHEAAEKGHTKVVKFLLNSNANPGFWDKSGKTALQIAGNSETIELLEQVECRMQ